MSSKPFTQVVDESASMDKIPKWFSGARLNFAENILRFCDDKIAIYALREGLKEFKTISFKELKENVIKCAISLRKSGVEAGDKVALYAPNCIESVIIALGAAAIGAVITCASPDFGVTGVLERLAQTNPRILFTVNAVFYNGKVHEHSSKASQVLKELPSVEKVIVLNFISSARLDCQQIHKNW